MTSLNNPRVADARKLLRRAYRKERQRFIIEGVRAVRDALDSGAAIEELFVSQEHDLSELTALAAERNVSVHVVGRQVIKALSDSVSPQGVVAVARVPGSGLESLNGDLAVVVDGVGDPGNAGTIIRTAAAAGASAVAFVTGSVDPFGPKTVRGAAGALFSLPVIAEVELADVCRVARERGMLVLGTAVGAEAAYFDVDLTRALAVVVGNEAWGVPESHLELMDEVVTIPMMGEAESLNVATATSVILFEALRQRRLSSLEKKE